MTEAKCKNCGYVWNTNSEMVLVSCPSCGNKVKIREPNFSEVTDSIVKHQRKENKEEKKK